ncbi:Diaminobutyrate-pyruvate aminotransferase [Cronobacter dublinensis 1210]|uniref:Diaminobutyrate-pyruvate aminotransferase n=1 Tax=Cronobacter dublinensis 1210 TaxID=1208656 RepID=A0ABP1WGF6_9ENTR|nr:Diaminobutyrate-pyruvate aminotransferase [Cronobacter dublinensis 1210]
MTRKITPGSTFLSCAGAVNYGHNPDALKQALLEYVANDGIQAALDLHSEAKMAFILDFHRLILAPRALDYRMQFTSPTGTSVWSRLSSLPAKRASAPPSWRLPMAFTACRQRRWG